MSHAHIIISSFEEIPDAARFTGSRENFFVGSLTHGGLAVG